MSLRTALTTSRRTLGGFAAIGAVWGTFAVMVPELKAGLGASDALFGTLLLGSAFGLVTATWLAPLADRKLGARGLPFAALALVLLVPLLAFAPSPAAFALVMVALGMASGVTDVVSNARVSDLEASHGRAFMNLNHAVFSFVYAGAALVAGIGREIGLPIPVILTAPLVVVLPLLRVIAIAPASSDDHATNGHRITLPVWPVAICGVVVLAAFMSEAAVEAWSALHLERTLGGRAAEGALGPAMLGLTMGIGRLSGQLLAERLEAGRVAIAGALLAAIGIVAAAIAQTPAQAVLGFGIFGLGVSVVGPLGLAMVGLRVPATLRTRAVARVAVVGFSGFFVAPPLMGVVSELGGLRIAFACVALLLMVVPLALWLGRARMPVLVNN